MPMSEAQIRAKENYRKKMIRQYLLKLNKKYDAEIIEHLDSIEGSKNDYIKQLILKDMRKK